MDPDEMTGCYVCGCTGCNHCMQRGEFEEETEFYGTDPAELACSCGSD